MFPTPEIEHPQSEAFHENTPPRFEGTTDIVNGLPSDAEIDTGRRTVCVCGVSPRSGRDERRRINGANISVAGSDASANSIG